jgi:hypothetical protein
VLGFISLCKHPGGAEYTLFSACNSAGDRMKLIGAYFAGSRGMKYILLSLVMLVVADGLISQFLMKHGLGREGNPFLQAFVNGGEFLLLKVLGALLSALILWDIYKSRPKVGLISSLVFMVLYTGIVLWNLTVFFITQV